MLWGMLLGGFATTAATIDHAVLAILAYPEQRHSLQGDAVASERIRNNSGQSYPLRGLHGPPFCRRKPLPRLPKVTLVARARTASLCFSASVSIATKAAAFRVRNGSRELLQNFRIFWLADFASESIVSTDAAQSVVLQGCARHRFALYSLRG